LSRLTIVIVNGREFQRSAAVIPNTKRAKRIENKGHFQHKTFVCKIFAISLQCPCAETIVR
ncbi:MAG: hypothetical protein J1F40_02325, partial [Prevotellaceae bacterium]|nr:hypothetical protein [Prevotellaceae bacterium]